MKKYAVALLVLVAISLPVFADQVDLGGALLTRDISVTLSGVRGGTFRVGLYEISVRDDAGAFLYSTSGYCVDFTNNADFNPQTAIFDSMMNWSGYGVITDHLSERGQMAAWLFRTYGEQADTADEAAALQLAIWEVLYEAWDNIGNLGSGNFYSGANTTIRGFANTWAAAAFNLGSPNQADATYIRVPLSNPDGSRQDWMIIVPEPTGLLLLGMGLVGLGIWSRKRL